MNQESPIDDTVSDSPKETFRICRRRPTSISDSFADGQVVAFIVSC